jgi:hypothetical protein
VEAALFRSALFFGAVFMNGMTVYAAELPVGFGVGPDNKPVPDLKAGVIVGSGPVSLLTFGVPDCPTGAGCPNQSISRPYLVSGDLVAVTDAIPGYVYVTYPTSKRLYEGWVPSGRVDLPTKGIPTPLNAWVGQWYGDSYRNQEIDITVDGDAVRVVGSSTNPHDDGEADITGKAVPQGNLLFVTDSSYDSCMVKAVLLNGVLAMRDTMSCHGASTSLSGIYRREAPAE